uniref:Protein kinase domain-containing protein n=1 Tax=Caenorhabditis tropicalis TaxID=1561998 RepID=A0A1I7ULC5_9PELO
MSEDEDKPDRQVESIRLDIGTEVTNDGEKLWITLREIGKGAFGTVYHVVNKKTRQEAALKVERITGGDNLLKIEKEIMLVMQGEEKAIHVYDDGIFNDFRFIVMTLCGPDLQKIAEMMNNTFSQETIIRLCIRTLFAIKILHEHEYIHRDLKPCNFAVDFNPNLHNVYLFDYGMARRFAKKDVGGQYWMRRPREQVQFRGTVRYCSLNMHKRKELGRVDDIWSWFFMMMEMRSPLPWSATAVPEKAEALKEEHLVSFLEKDPFLRSFVSIVAILNATDYADRPDYTKIFGILCTNFEK